MKVPFVDLYPQYLNLKEEIDHVIEKVIKNSLFIRGLYVDLFEEKFASMIERKYCVSCANGTDALYIAMKSLGVRPGDEVITSSSSWISTAEAITQAGGNVVFCDVDDQTFTIDPAQIESKINSRTVGIIPVHLYGQAADMDQIMSIARRHGLWVLEDCAQAHLARFRGKVVGSFGNAASFSFYPSKNLGAMGDAGALVTDDAALAEKMTMFARHGGLKKGQHEIEGINSRMDGLQAAILSVKIPHLAHWNSTRRIKAEVYARGLQGVPGLQCPIAKKDREHVWHLYVLKLEGRSYLIDFLRQRGVETAINYPVALPFLPAYKHLQHTKEEFSKSWAHQSLVVSLPMFPELSEEQQKYTIGEIRNFMELHRESSSK